MRLSHLNALRALEATLRLGSFTAAAGELGITPAAVGQRIRALEAYLGRDLFQRTATGATPTREAGKALPFLETGFSALERAFEVLAPENSRKTAWITMPESFAENWFAHLLSDFTLTCPDVKLRLDASNKDHDLLADDFDFAIRYGKPLGAPFEETDLFGDSVQPVCSPEFAREHALGDGRSDLDGVPLIHVLDRTGDPGWVGFDEWGRTFGFDPSEFDHGIRFARTSSGLQSAVAGQGLVIAGLVESYHLLADGRLTMPFGASRRCETTYRYRLVHKQGAAATGYRRAIKIWVLAHSERYRKDIRTMLKQLAS